MKKIFIIFALLILLLPLNALVITFDDVQGSGVNTYTDVNTTHGFNFTTNLDVIDIGGSSWGGSGPAVSGRYAVLNNNGGTGVITKSGGGTFSFNSVFARTWYTGNSGTKTIYGYRNGAQVASQTFYLTSSFQQITAAGSGFNNIDRLDFVFGNYFLITEFTDVNLSSLRFFYCIVCSTQYKKRVHIFDMHPFSLSQ